MLARLVELCLRRRLAVALVAGLALLLGGRQLGQAPLDVLPEFVPPQVSIQTEAPGFSPEQVEELVTRPVEAAVNGAPGLESLRSESIPGLSVVNLGFVPEVDAQGVRQGVAERLASLAGALPSGVGSPKLSPLTSSTMDLLKVGLVSKRLDPFALRDLADLEIRPRLLAVPGVARITVFGGELRQIQIRPRAERLAAYGLNLRDLTAGAREALTLSGAGFVDLPAQQVVIATPTPRPDPAALAQAVVATRAGTSIRLGDVAEVTLGAAVKAGDTRIQGQPGVLLTMSGQYGANTLATTRAIEAALAEMRPALEARGVELYPALHRPANFIERALTDLGRSLALGALLILAILLLFLRDLRSALISFLTIPLSLLAAVAVLEAFGQTLNTMALGGFAVALGVLVDDAIIDLENIVRRLRENARLAEPQPRLAVMRDASLEIRASVLYATVVVLVVFLPVLLAQGVDGRFLRPLALAFVLAVLASLLVAFTVTPALCALLLPEGGGPRPARWLEGLKRGHGRLLGWVERAFWPCLLALFLLLAAASAWLPFLGSELMPAFREGHFVLQVSSRAPGTSLAEMLALGERISQDVLALPFVATIEQQVGRAELGEDTWGPHRSEFHVELKADAQVDQQEAQEELRRVLANYPAARSEVMTFLGDRISESLTGETAQVVVNLFGERLDELDRSGQAVAAALEGTPGIVELQLKRESGAPQLAVELDPRALATYGVSAGEVLEAVAMANAGLEVGETFDGARTVPVVVIEPPERRSSLSGLESLPIATPAGPVPLARLATLAPRAGRFTLQHEGGRRRVAVTFNVEGRSLQATVAEARQRIAGRAHLPPGVVASFAGEAEAERQTRERLLVDSALAAALILLALALAFRRRRFPWLVMAGAPFCLLGSVLAIGFSGVGLTLGALVGLVTVFGVGARNSILLLAHYEHLLDHEGAVWSRETLRRGASERLVPILMTALVTGLGLVPLALGLGRPGHEIEGPLAVTVLGGLATSTLLNLLLMPEVVWRWGRTAPMSPFSPASR